MAFLRGFGVDKGLCYVGNCKIESECLIAVFLPSLFMLLESV